MYCREIHFLSTIYLRMNSKKNTIRAAIRHSIKPCLTPLAQNQTSGQKLQVLTFFGQLIKSWSAISPFTLTIVSGSFTSIVHHRCLKSTGRLQGCYVYWSLRFDLFSYPEVFDWHLQERSDQQKQLRNTFLNKFPIPQKRSYSIPFHPSFPS